MLSEKITCTRCVYDNHYSPSIKFDDEGVCNYCHQVEDLKDRYGTGTSVGKAKFDEIVAKMKYDGRNKKYDCVMGVSGGTDSSYMAHLAVKEYGLRPLAVHLDNTFNNSVATQNIHKVLGKLNIDLVTHVVDRREAEDIYRAFFKASVVDFDVFADIGVPQLLYKTAARHGLKYQLEGHSFIAEGVSPLGTMYADGKYLQSVHEKFGTVPLRTFPNMDFVNFVKWVTLYRIQKIRPLWYVSYTKEDARELLSREYDWKYYDGHHLENRTGAFHHSIIGPKKFNIDSRANSLSASVRSGKITRDAALSELETEPVVEPGLEEYMRTRLGLSQAEYQEIMEAPTNTWRDFPTYKKRFERFRPFFHVLLKFNLIPESFFVKYCFPFEEK
jgi:N-acetyl sugar amidotransferase